jgi:hypothetical protein
MQCFISSYITYSYLRVCHARYSVRDVTCLDAVITAIELRKYLQNLSCVTTNIVVVCGPEAYIGQHMCIKHADICGL